jgi:hypothetical protein
MASADEARMACQCVHPAKKLIRLYGKEKEPSDVLDVLVEKVCAVCQETVALIRMKIDKSFLKRVDRKDTK